MNNNWKKEFLNRGLVAIESNEGIYLSWRLLSDDPSQIAFNVYREDKSETQQINETPITETTDLLDKTSENGMSYRYVLKSVINGEEKKEAYVEVRQTGKTKEIPYFSIPFEGNYSAQKMALGDLDGDGELEFVIKQPDFNVDPYQHPGYWKPSRETYKLEAYKLDGTMMWRYDMGWSIEEGIWYSPYVVYDLDGDGKADVYTKAGEGDPRDEDHRVTSGPEYLIKIDGETGEVVERIPWLSREGFKSYNYYCRNFLTVAYLDGVNPYLIVERGTYGIIKIAAYDADLNQVWYFEASGENSKYQSQGAHGLTVADTDGDGRDELVIGSAVIDDDGKPIWTTGLGHPDVMYVADIDPDRPGLEIFYGIEPGHERNSVCLVDAKTGEIIWGYDGPTKHVHGQGMVANIVPDYQGIECYASEKDGSQTWFYNAKGKLISTDRMGGTTPRAVWWDADEYKELFYNGKLKKYKGEEFGQIEGRLLAIADVLGDWREEIVTSLNGEMRIYMSDIPAKNRSVCLLQDRQYRLGVVAQSMGYYYPPQLSLR